MGTPSAELVVGLVSAIGGLAAAVAAWWAARMALRIAHLDRNAGDIREARAEAWTVLAVRIENLLSLMTVAERAIEEGGAWVVGEGRGTDPQFRTLAAPAQADAGGPATAEFRARLLITREYLPLTRSLVLDGVPFSAGDAYAPFEALRDDYPGHEGWWPGLELNDVDPIGIQVVRAEILLAVRGIEQAAENIAASTASEASVLSGWRLAFKPPSRLDGHHAP
jgi:hypothetical protein